jgi:hypothetical protein
MRRSIPRAAPANLVLKALGIFAFLSMSRGIHSGAAMPRAEAKVAK